MRTLVRRHERDGNAPAVAYLYPHDVKAGPYLRADCGPAHRAVARQGFVVDLIERCRADYWLLKDGQEAIGVVILERGHGVVTYEYRVNDKTYQGADHRSLRDPKYANVTVGEHTIVHFSASHPWLSSIDLPTTALPAGWPLILFVWFVEARLIGTIVMPGSKWALKMTGKNAFSLRSVRTTSSRSGE